MGIPIKHPKLTSVYKLAYHLPNTSVEQSCPTHTGVRLMFEPLAKPNVKAKMINCAIPPAPASGEQVNHRQRTERKHIATVAIMILNLPIRSAMKPGAHRPKKEPTLRMERSWYENVEFTP